jgi:eukaryotic-like serine/threonine-protein kinase
MSRVEADVLMGGRYRLIRKMAAGGMGHVWDAEDTVLHRVVAIKMLSEGLSSDPNSAERFRREAQAAAGLSHPNVAGVFDYGEDDGTQFIVMELIEGETLAERIARVGRLGPAEATQIAVQVASALDAAHEAGVVHRDIKPGNVMLTPQGEVKVLDFGIAAAAGPSLTATGFTIGTATYLSPEQAAGERATPASDVYSLGVVLYEMLAGRPPFHGESPVAVAAAHVSREVPSLIEQVPDLPPHVAQACEQALAKDPAARPPTAGAFRQMLEAPSEPVDPAVASIEGSDGHPSTEQATAVLPPPDSTAVLPPTQQPSPDGPQPTQGRRRPTPARGIVLPRNRAAWALGGILVGLLLLALLLSSVLGGDLSSPARAVKVRVPRMAGLGVAEAEQALRDRGFAIADVKFVEGPADTVVRSDPPGGILVAFGSTVTLYVGTPPETPADEGGGKGKGKGKGRGD